MRRSAGHGDCTIGKDTQGNIYRRRSRRALRADQYFRTGPTGGQPEQDGRSLPLSPRCRLPLRRVVSESTAPPGRRVRLSSDGGRERDGRHGRPAARVQGAAAGSPRTAGEVCRATGCPTGKGILCDESQTFPLQVNGTEKTPEFLLRGNKLRKLVNCDEILRAEATPGIPLKVEIMHTVVCRTAAGFTSGPVLFQQTGLQCPESLPECPVLFAVTESHGPGTQLDQEIIQFLRLL